MKLLAFVCLIFLFARGAAAELGYGWAYSQQAISNSLLGSNNTWTGTNDYTQRILLPAGSAATRALYFTLTGPSFALISGGLGVHYNSTTTTHWFDVSTGYTLATSLMVGWSNTADAVTGTIDTRLTRFAAGVVKFDDSAKLDPLASPPVTCTAQTNEGAIYYDDSGAFCVCLETGAGSWSWHELGTGVGSCS